MTKFSINVYGPSRATPKFVHLANLFHPRTVDACYEHDGAGTTPGIKEEGDGGRSTWNTKGHHDRLVHVGPRELALFAKLYDESGTPLLQARLPAVHSRKLISALENFVNTSENLGDLVGNDRAFINSTHWNEKNAQVDGTIWRDTGFVGTPTKLILSGPHFYVGNPLSKTPRSICTQNGHYDVLDLSYLPNDYLPRANYHPAGNFPTYAARIPRVSWVEEKEYKAKPFTDYYRVISRRALSISGERTLVTAIAPPQVCHIDGLISVSLKDKGDVPTIAGLWASLPFDFFVKTSGKGDFRNSLAEFLVVPRLSFYHFIWQIFS